MKMIRLNQGTEEWLRWRADGIGGSDIAAIVGVSPYEGQDRISVMERKVSGKEQPANRAMWRGSKLEPVVRKWFEVQRNKAFPPICVEHDKLAFARVSLDGYADDGDVLEIKCPNWRAHDLILNKYCPEYFSVQCQWQMVATGAKYVHLVSYNPSKRFAMHDWFAHMVVRESPGVQRHLVTEATKFWDEVQQLRGNGQLGTAATYTNEVMNNVRELRAMGVLD